jgi:chemotaxis protein CheZ
VQRKIFRIEQMKGERGAHPHATASASHTASHDLACVRETLADNMRALSTLLHDGKDRRMTRAAGDLGAAIEAMEKATEKILRAAERIDDCVRALAAAQMTDFEAGLVQDIQEHLVGIYEACNFQDLSGQRIGKVIGTLGLVENQLTSIIADSTDLGPVYAPPTSPQAELLNGPRLDGESGHARQSEIDALFS